jgi:hypothetical protein
VLIPHVGQRVKCAVSSMPDHIWEVRAVAATNVTVRLVVQDRKHRSPGMYHIGMVVTIPYTRFERDWKQA